MRTKKTDYPEWIQKHRKEGTTVKNIRGKYYLYRRVTSKRVEGKKNPQPIYEFLGTITEEGLIPPQKRRLDISDVIVRELGFTYALMNVCPISWKEIQGEKWEEKLKAIVVSRSKNSYILDTSDHIKSAEELRMQLGTVVSSLGRKLSDALHVSLDELQSLDTIYLVKTDGKYFVSRVSEVQQAVLDRIGIHLEVPEGLH